MGLGQSDYTIYLSRYGQKLSWIAALEDTKRDSISPWPSIQRHKILPRS